MLTSTQRTFQRLKSTLRGSWPILTLLQKGILVEVYNRPMHLSLNNLLLSSEVMASINPNNPVDLQQAADSIQ